MGTGVRHIDQVQDRGLPGDRRARVPGRHSGSTCAVLACHVFHRDVEQHRHAGRDIHVLSGADHGRQLEFERAVDQQLFLLLRRLRTQSSSADSWQQSSSGITGGSFAAISTVSTLFGYAVEIQDTDLDLTNAFKCVQVGVTAASSITQAVWAHCFPRFDGNFAAASDRSDLRTGGGRWVAGGGKIPPLATHERQSWGKSFL